MSRCFTLVAVAALAFAAANFVPRDAGAQTAPPVETILDHFKCYEVIAGEIPPVPVLTLTDQYETDDVAVLAPRFFCNPVNKLHDGVFIPIVDPRDHLTCYDIAGSVATNRKNKTVNQFETRKLTMTEPELLCIPTDKNFEGPPIDLDHFKCYQTAGADKNAPVVLQDQFSAGDAVVREAVMNCNPTKKLRPDGEVTDILHPEAHLTCYRLDDFAPPTTTSVIIRHQLLPNGSDLGIDPRAKLLCVPALKRSARCGLSYELALLAPLLGALRRRRRR